MRPQLVKPERRVLAQRAANLVVSAAVAEQQEPEQREPEQRELEQRELERQELEQREPLLLVEAWEPAAMVSSPLVVVAQLVLEALLVVVALVVPVLAALQVQEVEFVEFVPKLALAEPMELRQWGLRFPVSLGQQVLQELELQELELPAPERLGAELKRVRSMQVVWEMSTEYLFVVDLPDWESAVEKSAWAERLQEEALGAARQLVVQVASAPVSREGSVVTVGVEVRAQARETLAAPVHSEAQPLD